MRIAFFAFGTRGDVEPFVALAKGFVDAGHDVIFITDESAIPLVAPHGLRAHKLQGNFRERWAAPAHRRTFHSRFPYGLARALSAPVAERIASWVVEATEAAQGSKLVVGSSANRGLGYIVAEKVRAVPCQVSVMPIAPSRYLPPTVWPWPSAPFPPGVNRLLQEAAIRAAWLASREGFNTARRALQLPEVSWPFGGSRPRLLDGIPQLYGFSPTLLPPPPDWPGNITVTGTWQHRLQKDWRPPPPLAAFLEAGPPPVYVGFGSMFEPRPAQLWDIVLGSLRELGLRAVVAKGWGAMVDAQSSSEILVIDDVPHEWLFPRVAAVVHHGGSGTVGAALRAGRTSVVVPYIADQPFWGWALERLGVAPKMIPRRRLSMAALTAALARAMTETMGKRAREIGEIVRAEDGVRRAVEVIEPWLSPFRSSVPTAARPPAAPAAISK